MKVVSISNLTALKVLNESTNEVHLGCDQEWFATKWQRLSGCGPCVASNIIFYLDQKHRPFEKRKCLIMKKECLLIMENVWNYITPTSKGIYTTKMFYEAVLSYMNSKGFNIEYGFIDIPKEKSDRPKLSEVLDFINKALLYDIPVAFLNLCNGDEKNLERWHWVTIISLDYQEKENCTFVIALDEGIIKKIDLKLWYYTTSQGGGFVYFIPVNSVDNKLL